MDEKPRSNQPKKQKRKKKKTKWYRWGLIVLLLSFLLTVLFAFLSEICISGTPVYAGILVLIVLLVLNIASDILANAVVSCPTESFLSMAAQKIKGAKRAVSMCKNAPKLSSIFADVIGDICGIVSGSVCAALVVRLAAEGTTEELVISILISAIIGALTVGGKAFFKVLAVKYNTKIVFFVAKVSTVFKKEK